MEITTGLIMVCHIGTGEETQMMSENENGSQVVVSGEQVQKQMGERVDVEGEPVTGRRVEIEYSSNAGGSYGSDRPCTISGELLYVSEYGTDSYQMVVRDDDRGRSVRFNTSGPRSLKSLAARRTKRGRSIGNILSITFTDEDVSGLAPVMNVLRRVIAGDTVMVDGEEYGVVSVSEYGPETAPDKFSAILTTREGEEYTLVANAAYNTASATFGPRFCDDESVDPSVVSVGRHRERFFDGNNEGLDTEDTTDAFPAPHYGREGERVTFTLTGGEDVPEEQVSGEVTDVRYFSRKESSWFSDPEEKDPETTVELDDGRKVVLQNASRRGSSHITRSRREDIGENGKVKAMVVTHHEDADNEYAHVEAVDIQREGEEEGPARTDGGRVMADGGVQGDVCEDCGHRGEDVRPVVVAGMSSEHLCKGCSPLASARPDNTPAECQNCGDVASDVEPVHGPSSTEWLCPGCSPLRADGGEDVETLAGSVSDALASSDIAMSRVSVSVTEVDTDVTVQANGHISREDWNELREDITDALDAAGFKFTVRSEWAFVRVDGRKVRADGGSSTTRNASGVRDDDPHADVKRRVIGLDAVVMVKTGGESGEYVVVYRLKDAELDDYHTLMDLAGYTDVDPFTTLDENPGGVTGEDVVLDVWERKAVTDGGVVRGGEESAVTLAMDAVYSAIRRTGCEDSVTVIPHSVGCSIKFSGSIGDTIREQLDGLGLEMEIGDTISGPDVGDCSGTIHVTGFSDGGEGDE